MAVKKTGGYVWRADPMQDVKGFLKDKVIRNPDDRTPEDRSDYIKSLMEDPNDTEAKRKHLYWDWPNEDATKATYMAFIKKPEDDKPRVTDYRLNPFFDEKHREAFASINQALEAGDILLNDSLKMAHKYGSLPMLEESYKNEKEANKILVHRLTNATEYSKKVEGWLHTAAHKAEVFGATLLIVSILAIISITLNLYFLFR